MAKVEQASYNLRQKETEAHLKSPITTVCRGFYLRTWIEALDAFEVDKSLELRNLEKVFYPPAIKVKVIASKVTMPL